ncbi:unnamed protein product [Paramecium octaurelia]|uniref:Uncharacterized protein n=1 Tax=Paramecium octaurelia TaxID=43137 RepID=A0A8S1WMA1_PAROT|nr:unnamed protein product [Paramecium octaurelia]
MESAFIFGCLFGMGIRMTVSRVIRQPLLYKCHQYPKYMFLTGLAFSGFDWIRRLSLETLCEKEELQEFLVRTARINQLATGAESVGDYKKEFIQIAVDEHIY